MSEPTPPPGDNPPQPPAGATPPPPPPAGAVPPPPPAGGTPPPPPPAYGQTPVPGVSPDGRQYADWIWRVLAYLIDYIPAGVLVGIGYLMVIMMTSTSVVERQTASGYTFTTMETSTSPFGLLLAFIFYIAALAYWIWNKAYREGTTGKSIGKQVTGYTTLKEDTGQPLGFGMGFVRLLLLWVDFAICYIGVLWPLWDPKRQCLLSDKVTGAVVYKD